METEILARVCAYELRHKVHVGRALGDGQHGKVFVVRDNSKSATFATKFHHRREPYGREFSVYQRLREKGISTIRGFNLPVLVHAEPDLMILEMTIVDQPFLVDFAGAFLDGIPPFPDDVWTHWETEKAEAFGTRWLEVQKVLSELRCLGIHLLDVNPNNLKYADD